MNVASASNRALSLYLLQAARHPDLCPPLPSSPLPPILLLAVLKNHPEKGQSARDHGSDEHRVALTFTWNIILTGAKVASDED